MKESPYGKKTDIIKKLTEAEIVKETHISYAVIASDYVYKIKKSVDFGFLDYRELKSRRVFSILEKELNSRFSHGVYLEVLKLVRRSAAQFALVPLDNSLPALEYVLKMKRIADGDFLASRMEAGLVSIEDMRKIGGETAILLKNLEKAPAEEGFAAYCDVIKFNADENFRQTEKYSGSFLDKESYDFIKKSAFEFIEENEELFNQRAARGFVKNGHGDLRLEHIYFNADGTVGLIDCIEFNKRFRYIDVVAEAAFLSMEMDFQGLTDFSDAFIEGFLNVFPEPEGAKLINYYRAYFSFVRSKVACFVLEEKGPSWEGFEEKFREVKRLTDMSAYYSLGLRGPLVPLFYGLMGTGKTKNAKIFAARFPIYRVNSDEERKKTAGMKPTDRAYEEWGKGIYSFNNSVELYKSMGKTVTGKRSLGRLSIVDASFSDPAFLSSFNENYSGPLKFIRFTAPLEIIKERLEARIYSESVADGRMAIFNDQLAAARFPEAELTIDTAGDPRLNVEQIFKFLIK